MKTTAARYVSVADAAIHYGVHEDTIYRGVATKRLPSIRVGRVIRVNLDELDEVFGRPAERDPDGSMRTTRARRRPPPR
jgi:excisionase family DNA binding protein